jgi:hypothetical protein
MHSSSHLPIPSAANPSKLVTPGDPRSPLTGPPFAQLDGLDTPTLRRPPSRLALVRRRSDLPRGDWPVPPSILRPAAATFVQPTDEARTNRRGIRRAAATCCSVRQASHVTENPSKKAHLPGGTPEGMPPRGCGYQTIPQIEIRQGLLPGATGQSSRISRRQYANHGSGPA